MQTANDIDAPWVQREWGFYKVLSAFQEGCQVKVKLLSIKPGGKIKKQRHKHRAEQWIFLVQDTLPRGETLPRYTVVISKGENDEVIISPARVHFNRMDWHTVTNLSEIDLLVLEVQYGDLTEEDDIERA